MFAKYYENPTMLSRVIAKNVGDVFFETHCRLYNAPYNVWVCCCIKLKASEESSAVVKDFREVGYTVTVYTCKKVREFIHGV